MLVVSDRWPDGCRCRTCRWRVLVSPERRVSLHWCHCSPRCSDVRTNWCGSEWRFARMSLEPPRKCKPNHPNPTEDRRPRSESRAMLEPQRGNWVNPIWERRRYRPRLRSSLERQWRRKWTQPVLLCEFLREESEEDLPLHSNILDRDQRMDVVHQWVDHTDVVRADRPWNRRKWHRHGRGCLSPEFHRVYPPEHWMCHQIRRDNNISMHSNLHLVLGLDEDQTRVRSSSVLLSHEIEPRSSQLNWRNWPMSRESFPRVEFSRSALRHEAMEPEERQ